jgi:hypothetical protein
MELLPALPFFFLFFLVSALFISFSSSLSSSSWESITLAISGADLVESTAGSLRGRLAKGRAVPADPDPAACLRVVATAYRCTLVSLSSRSGVVPYLLLFLYMCAVRACVCVCVRAAGSTHTAYGEGKGDQG